MVIPIMLLWIELEESEWAREREGGREEDKGGGGWERQGEEGTERQRGGKTKRETGRGRGWETGKEKRERGSEIKIRNTVLNMNASKTCTISNRNTYHMPDKWINNVDLKFECEGWAWTNK